MSDTDKTVTQIVGSGGAKILSRFGVGPHDETPLEAAERRKKQQDSRVEALKVRRLKQSSGAGGSGLFGSNDTLG